MDGSKSRKSDAAATRKRRSSILKSQRNVRAPLSELEFNVATPDQAKSRRVSFSRRTGVAEFEISEATTAWKNVYEEHNKSLESSANESGAPPRRVGHLGARASQFEDDEADVIDATEPQAPPTAQLDELPTNTNTIQAWYRYYFNYNHLSRKTSTEGQRRSIIIIISPFQSTAGHRSLPRGGVEPKVTRGDIEHSGAAAATAFADHFSSVFLPDEPALDPQVASASLPADARHVDVKCLTSTDIRNAVKKLKSSAAPGPDAIPAFLIKACIDDLVAPIKFMFNLLLDSGVYPAVWKRSRVTPIPKAGSKLKVENYRPIAILSVLAKIFESAIQGRLLPQCLAHITDAQHAFLPKRSVATNLLTLTQILSRELDRKAQVDVVYLDFQKAFDRVDNDILLMKLGAMGFAPRLLKLFASYLSGRTQNKIDSIKLVEVCVRLFVPNQYTRARRHPLLAGGSARTQAHAQAPVARAHALLNSLLEAQPQCDLFLFRLESNPGHREVTDNLAVDFSAVAPLADDLEALRRDLEREPQRANISEISIDLDFNATHFSLKADEDDMSITDTIRSPAVAATKKQVEDWTVDKENIVINPYIAPPPAEFPCEDDILVFDGKKCKFQSKLDISDAPLESVGENISPKTVVGDMTQAIPVRLQANIQDKSVLNTARGRTVVFGDDGDMSVTQGVANNIIAAKAVHEDKENQRTMYFNDLPDMSVTQALPADIIQNEPQLKTILYEDDAHISMTEAVPARVLAGPENLTLEANLENKRPIVYENADVSMTLEVSGVIQEVKGSEDRRKTIVFGNDDGNVSVTGVLPANIIDEVKIQPNMEQRKAIGFADEDGHVSMTGVLPANIIDEAKLVPPPNTEQRKIIVYGNDNGNLSVTGVLPTKIINETKLTQLNTDRRRTVVFGNDDGNLSMTGVAPVNILDGAKVTQEPHTDRRKTIVYNNAEGNVSMTGVLPVNIIDEAKVQQAIERRKTIVYDNDDGNVSITSVLPANIIDAPKAIQQSMDSKKTVVFGNDDGNLSMTGIAPINKLDGAKDPNAERRKTIVYENDGGNISMTGVVPANILNGAKETQEMNTDRRKTIVYNNDDGNISITGVVPVNIFDVAKETQEPNADRRKTIVYDNDEGNISVTGVVPVNILDEAKQLPTDCRKTMGYGLDDDNVAKTDVSTNDDGANKQPLDAIRRITVVYDRDNGNLCKTGVAAINILDEANKQTEHKTVYMTDNGNLPLSAAASELLEDANERRKTVFGDDDNNVSVTGIIPANIIQDEAKLIQSLNEERRKTIAYGNEDANVSATGDTPENIIDKESDKKQPETSRKSGYGVEDKSKSVIEILLANMLDQEDGVKITHEVHEDDGTNMSITGDIPNIIDEAKSTRAPNERRITIVYEDSDVSMRSFKERKTHTSIICENTETQQNELEVFDEKDEQVEMIEAFIIPKLIESDEGDVSMTQADGPQSPKNLRSATFNKSLANQDITSLNKSLAGQINFTIDNTLADQTFDKSVDTTQTFNKSLADPVLSTAFNKKSADVTTAEKSQVDPHSATFNKSLANQELATTKSLAGQEPATLNKSVAGQESTVNKTLTVPSKSMNKILTSNVLVYGATTERKAKVSDNSYMDGLNLADNQSQESTNASLALSKSSAEQLARSRIEAVMTPPKGSVLDVLLDMSQASGEDTWNKPQSTTVTESVSSITVTATESTTVTEPVSNITVTATDTVFTSDSDVLVKDDVPDEPALEVTQPLAIEYKKQKHGIVCNLQKKLSELKNMLHVRQKSPKKIKNKSEYQDLTHITPNLDTPKTTDSFEKKKLPKPSLKSRGSNLDTPKINESFEKSKLLKPSLNSRTSNLDSPKINESYEKSKVPKPSLNSRSSNLDTLKINESFEKSKMLKPSLKLKALKSPSSPNKDVQEKNKSMSIDLLSEMFIYDEEESVLDNQIQVDLTSIEDEEQPNTNRCQANDTKAILDALSDFTDTRRSGDFEAAHNQNNTKRSSAPDRKSMVISREDLLRGISMAQALMKTEMAQTEMELDATEGSSDEQEPSPPRLSGEVVKTLRFDDDDSILEPKLLQKPVSTDCPSVRTSTVIPTYEISDPVKELMKELIKPLADVEQPPLSRPCQSSQANHLDSSQIDLISTKPIISPRSCLRKSEKEVAHSETHVVSPQREPAPVIVFDPSNPLNNVLIPPVDQAVVHKYNPIQPAPSISSSISFESQCCQTEAPGPRNMEVGMALVRPTVDRGVAPSALLGGGLVDRGVATDPAVKNCEVNTSIVMKGNRELLADSSSLTLVDDALPRSPVRVIFKLDEPYSSVMLDSDLTSVHDSSEPGRKRGRVAAQGPELDEPYSSVMLDSDLTSVHDSSEPGRKRGRVAAQGPELDEPYSSVMLDSDLTSVHHSSEPGRKRGHVAAQGPELDEPYSSVMLDSDLTSVHDSSEPGRKRGRVAAQGPELDEPYSSVMLDSDLTSVHHSSEPGRKRGHVAAQGPELDEPYSSVMLDSDLTSVHDSSEPGRKRGHVAARGPEVTPKPAMKVQKVSRNTKVSRSPRSPSPKGKYSSVSSSKGSTVTVAHLYASERSASSATDSRCSRVFVSDWRPELLHEASSKNLVAEQESGVNVVAKIDVLPFMGTYECEWESRAGDTWSFRLLRSRLRLLIRLEHRATNNTRSLVRADTPVRLVTVQHATLDQERTEPVAALCLCLAAQALQRVCARGVARAGAVPALLRRCAAIARVALHWGRCMRQASAALAFSLSEDGCLSLKVANIPLRSIWEVTLRVELFDDGRGAPHPRAAGVSVTPVLAAHPPTPTPAELRALLAAVPEDWGHVPRTIWKVFKYLKNKKPEDDLFIM
ncbi:uncharacterized protein LOC134676565 [Cydia fagiglandana]|uniref:uncharacterized protein LOC134676565 n=1 Tax=Cydia fagiglandana TaxID=1458189 RepID=UPI002FEE3310